MNPRKFPYIYINSAKFISRISISISLDELLGFEESSKVEDLPGGEAEKAAHAEYTEEEDSVVCGFCGRVGNEDSGV
jgi:hypothetical protein